MFTRNLQTSLVVQSFNLHDQTTLINSLCSFHKKTIVSLWDPRTLKKTLETKIKSCLHDMKSKNNDGK